MVQTEGAELPAREADDAADREQREARRPNRRPEACHHYAGHSEERWTGTNSRVSGDVRQRRMAQRKSALKNSKGFANRFLGVIQHLLYISVASTKIKLKFSCCNINVQQQLYPPTRTWPTQRGGIRPDHLSRVDLYPSRRRIQKVEQYQVLY